MATSYYTFEFGDQNVGYFEITETPERIDQIARFRMGSGEAASGEAGGDEIHNIFHLQVKNRQLIAFQYLDDEWVDMSTFTDHSFPSSAYPLLLAKANPIYRYHSINEGTTEISGHLTLTRDGDCITETESTPAGIEVRRRFWLTDGVVTKIDWGGPVSRLVGSREEAVAGSSYSK